MNRHVAAMKATAEKAGLTWEEVCNDPNLRDLPYKIETNEHGQIIMTATYFRRGKYQFRIGQLLAELLPEGEVVTEAAIRTTKGTKVADAVWCSAERWEKIKDDYDATIAPEICVEVLSSSNTPAEIEEKKRLYFEAGAEEVWTCNAKSGAMRFFATEGALKTSRRAPGFPKEVAL